MKGGRARGTVTPKMVARGTAMVAEEGVAQAKGRRLTGMTMTCVLFARMDAMRPCYLSAGMVDCAWSVRRFVRARDTFTHTRTPLNVQRPADV